jgi:DNA repair protein RAD50
MQIRGIRSFSPDRDETIEFYSPLTMIVGSNGCGKTTIIESLKFACTGSLPPNTKRLAPLLNCGTLHASIKAASYCKLNCVDSGQSLVNDPMMTDSTGVKAHIKLRFQNQSDQTCVAVRSLQVLKKKSKLEFKALEGVLRTTNKDGEKVSISMKCSDIDRIIPENLGISPAIIENVIFVHQEDCKYVYRANCDVRRHN